MKRPILNIEHIQGTSFIHFYKGLVRSILSNLCRRQELTACRRLLFSTCNPAVVKCNSADAYACSCYVDSVQCTGGMWRWKQRGALNPSGSSSLQPLSKNHFNLKHWLGVVNWHLLHTNIHSSICPLSHSPSSSVSLSHLSFHSCFLVSFHFHTFCLLARSPVLLLPLPPPVCSSPAEYTTYSNEYICVILPMQLRQPYIMILGGKNVFCYAPSSIKASMWSVKGRNGDGSSGE